ncbi:helix-turn-helix domain-containing protein [Bradyrhizobium sp. SZCCHNR2026]|uniref:helix-turn-helix domain-containing protein n=1 Tax=Bradyrhizobium sp. SZCCHNR2026 TaxID=3057381 RepID=UPI00291617B7|nr:helix-turn-helix domain-containing protein [Bradyrhizobium sp. SZCCHNR2026]
MSNSARRGRPTSYTPEMGNVVYRLMSQGLSLTAAAGAMGIARATVHNWMKRYPELLDSVERGQAARVYKLEIDMLSAGEAHIVHARRFALVNAAPAEWRRNGSGSVG